MIRGPSLTNRLVDLLERPISAAARGRAALHVLDWLGCAVIGVTTAPGGMLAGYGRRHAGDSGCHAIGVGAVAAPVAAFVNGGLGNVLEMDDVHRTSILHPGPVVIPAALACAERERTTATAFLDAVIRGYEAVIRIGSSVGPGHYRYWHNTATCGPFGAAAAAASLLALDRRQTIHTLGSAGTQASGLWQCREEGVMSKQLHTARAAHAGLVSADLAALGFTGPAFILEGPTGLYAATCPDADPAAVTADPEAPWKIFETSFKPWPACRHAHAAIDGALLLRREVVARDIARLTVNTYPDALRFCDCPEPRTTDEAKFSLQQAVAVTLVDGPPALAAFEPSTLARAEIAAVRRRVTVAVSDPIASAYPRRYGAEIVATLTDGSLRRVVVPNAKGDPENPMTAGEIEEKARTLMAAAKVAPPRIEAIISRTSALAAGGTLDALVSLLP